MQSKAVKNMKLAQSRKLSQFDMDMVDAIREILGMGNLYAAQKESRLPAYMSLSIGDGNKRVDTRSSS